MKKDRKPLNAKQRKLVFQEGQSICAFCLKSDLDILEVHHINDDPSDNDLNNLIILCASCHKRVTSGAVTYDQVRTQKHEVQRLWRMQCGIVTPDDILGEYIQPDTGHRFIATKSDEGHYKMITPEWSSVFYWAPNHKKYLGTFRYADMPQTLEPSFLPNQPNHNAVGFHVYEATTPYLYAVTMQWWLHERCGVHHFSIKRVIGFNKTNHSV